MVLQLARTAKPIIQPSVEGIVLAKVNGRGKKLQAKFIYHN